MSTEKILKVRKPVLVNWSAASRPHAGFKPSSAKKVKRKGVDTRPDGLCQLHRPDVTRDKGVCQAEQSDVPHLVGIAPVVHSVAPTSEYIF